VQNAWRIGIGAAVVVAAVVLFVFLRPGGGDDSTLASDTTSLRTTTEPSGTEPVDTTGSDTTGATTPANPTFRVDVPEGGPTEVQRLDVRQGQRVTIVVTLAEHSDVHLHGYDLLLHTGPGLPPARFRFQATTPGVFELELEETHKQIAELRVTP
jgi:hypothetical protein